jgi:hypothetical protein
MKRSTAEPAFRAGVQLVATVRAGTQEGHGGVRRGVPVGVEH